MYEKIKQPEPVYTADIKLIQVNKRTFERLKQHNYNYDKDDDDNMISFDEIIVRLIDFYEKNQNENDKEISEINSLI